MIRRLLGASFAAALAVAAVPAVAADAYTFDKNHSRIAFTWNHVGLSNQSARFGSFDGEILFDAEKPENSKVNITIDANSIDSGVKLFDEHLKGDGFFDVAKHPKATFVSTDVRKTGARSFQVTGNLTIKGKTRPVVLDATLNYTGDHPLAGYFKALAGSNWLGWSAHTRVRRSEFDLGQYAPLTSDTVDISIETELRQAPKK